MTIAEAQREMRTVYLDGAIGAFVSSVLWLAAAALGTWGSRNLAMLTLAAGARAPRAVAAHSP